MEKIRWNGWENKELLFYGNELNESTITCTIMWTWMNARMSIKGYTVGLALNGIKDIKGFWLDCMFTRLLN